MDGRWGEPAWAQWRRGQRRESPDRERRLKTGGHGRHGKRGLSQHRGLPPDRQKYSFGPKEPERGLVDPTGLLSAIGEIQTGQWAAAMLWTMTRMLTVYILLTEHEKRRGMCR